MNLNNILGSDSISPSGYYPKRVIGNKRFVVVSPENVSDHIILYEQVPPYQVTQEWGVNYAMFLEVETEQMLEHIENGPCIEGYKTYSVYGTIHINPLNTRILFPRRESYDYVKTLVEQSAENKTFNLYKVDILDREKIGRAPLNVLQEDMPDDQMDDKIRVDAITDKIRGAIVAFTAGKNCAPSPEVVELKRYARSIKNLVAAAANNAQHQLQSEREEELQVLLKDFDYLYSTIDPVVKENDRRIELQLASSPTLRRLGISVDDIKKVLEELGLSKTFENLCGLKPTYDVYSVTDCLLCGDVNNALSESISALNAAIRVLELRIKPDNQYPLASVATMTADGEVRFLSEDNGLKFFNEYLNALSRGGQLLIAKEKNVKKDVSLALLGGNILKEITGDQWQDSKLRVYVNSLISNLTAGDPFDVTANNQIVMQSFAAFVLKGSDIEKLTDFLIQNGISDYKYAWAMYGAAYGYAPMSKGFTNQVLGMSDYSRSLLVDMDRCVFGCRKIANVLPIPLEPSARQVSSPSPVKQGKFPSLSVEPVPQDVNELDDKSGILVGKPESYYNLKAFLSEAKSGTLVKRKIFKESQNNDILEAYERYGHFNEAFYDYVSKIRGVGEVAIKSLKEEFPLVSDSQELTFSEGMETNKESFVLTRPEKIVSEYNPKTNKQKVSISLEDEVCSVVDELRIGDSNVHDEIISKLKYALKNHPGEAAEEWIRHFENMVWKPYNGYTIPDNSLNKMIVESLVRELRQKFGSGR